MSRIIRRKTQTEKPPSALGRSLIIVLPLTPILPGNSDRARTDTHTVRMPHRN